jgi:tetratricopeptide (TPR) repeat protein
MRSLRLGQQRVRKPAGLLAVVGAAGLLTAQSAPQQQNQPSPTQQGAAALRAGKPWEALALFGQAIAADPQNAAANLLAASAEIALYQPTDALQYAERAQALEPGNWKVHTTLVTAYAMAGDTAHRDAERAILREAHENPALPDARETNGFLLDMFKAGRYRVEAVEYFKPLGRYNTYFRFIVRSGSGKDAGAPVWTIEVDSDSLNQSSWAQAYPRQAKEGQRQFQIESAQGATHTEYRTFSGAPSYDYIKPQVVKIVEAQTEPFPGEVLGQ